MRKTEQNQKVNGSQIRQLIDRFGEISEQLKELEAEKERLRNLLIEKIGEGKHYGLHYSIDISKKVYRVISPAKTLKKLGAKDFLKVVSVNITELKKLLPDFEIAELVEGEKEGFVVSVKKRNV